MKIKKIIKNFLPPIIHQLLVKKIKIRHIKRYKNFKEALIDSSLGGYETEDLITVVVEKNKKFRDELVISRSFDLGSLRTLIGIGLCGIKKNLNVLDYGGGGGYHYQIAKLALGEDIELNWCVVETQAMALLAQQNLSSTKLSFCSSLNEAEKILGKIDLIFTSGTLHCTDDPIKNLSDLFALRAPRLFITRTCFNDKNMKEVFVQSSKLSHNGPGPLPSGFKDRDIFYPNVFVPISDIRKVIGDCGYKIRFEIIEDANAYQFGDRVFGMYGFFCDIN